MIKEWLETYKPANTEEVLQALREIMQEIALAGLQRSGFFEVAAFYGGTALRIFHGLPRFSEDLDFSLLEKNNDFSLAPYLEAMENEFAALGIKVSVREKNKTTITAVDSAFLKPDTTWKELIIKEVLPDERIKLTPEIKIKLEVDTMPPPGFDTEEKLSLRPFSFYTKCFSLPDLFAGKMHALLFRKWKGRVKGRDWFDLEWYIQKGVPIHLDHFLQRAIDSGDWTKKTLTEKQFKQLLTDKIKAVSFKAVKEDIIRFIPDAKVTEIWSKDYFIDLTGKLRIK